MSTKIASKSVTKNFWNSFSFKNIYRMNTRHRPSVLNTKEKSTRFAGTSILKFVRSSHELSAWGKTTQFFTSRICSLWCCLWRKYKRGFCLQKYVLIFPKIAFRQGIRARNDLPRCQNFEHATDVSGPLTRMRVWSSRDCITSQTYKRTFCRVSFAVKFCESLHTS